MSLGEPKKVLLIKRLNEPFKGEWALPGGFVDHGEDLESAAMRELSEETGLKVQAPKQVGAFGDPDRDPRGHVISIAYFTEVDKESSYLKAGSDAGEYRWFPLEVLPKLAFDHIDIIEESIIRFHLR
jgi:8-oxo-dGTP diphosphatase